MPAAPLDYRDRYRRGVSPRHCPHCACGQMVRIESFLPGIGVHRPSGHERDSRPPRPIEAQMQQAQDSLWPPARSGKLGSRRVGTHSMVSVILDLERRSDAQHHNTVVAELLKY
jgi:hypothetical protein